MNTTLIRTGIAALAVAVAVPAAAVAANSAQEADDAAAACTYVLRDVTVCSYTSTSTGNPGQGDFTVAADVGAAVYGNEISQHVNTPEPLPDYTITQSEFDTEDETGDLAEADRTGLTTNLNAGNAVVTDGDELCVEIDNGQSGCQGVEVPVPNEVTLMKTGETEDAAVYANGKKAASVNCDIRVGPSSDESLVKALGVGAGATCVESDLIDAGDILDPITVDRPGS